MVHETDKELKVLILSARNTVEDKMDGLDTGYDDYLTKPFDLSTLEAHIRNPLRRSFT